MRNCTNPIGKKVRRGAAIFAAAVLSCLSAAACTKPPEVLAAPENLRVEEDLLLWDEVKGAAGYRVTVNGETTETAEPAFDVYWYIEPQTYRFEVTAFGDLPDSPAACYDYTVEEIVGSNGLNYYLLEDKSGYSVQRGYTSMRGVLTIPPFYNGLPVKRASSFSVTLDYGDNAYGKRLTEVRFPKTMEMIYGFQGLVSLTSVTLPRGVVIVSAFRNCSSLAEIRILGDKLTRIGSLEGTAWYENQKDGPMIVDGKVLYGYKGAVPEDGVGEIPSSVYLIDWECGENVTRLAIPEGIKFVYDGTKLKETLKSIVVPKSLQTPLLEFAKEKVLEEIFYRGTREELDAQFPPNIYRFADELWYFYSETRPEEEGNFWHYVDGEIVKW